MLTLHTIGHSNQPAAALVDTLERAGVRCLADVRASPRSKRNPQFDRKALERTLDAAGIRYLWLGDALGGFRRARPDSPHVALEEPGFRGFADHMATSTFREALGRLVAAGREAPLAVMCAEADYRSCHRQFIADALMLAGHAVVHLRAGHAPRSHALHPALDATHEPPVYNKHAQGDLFA